MSISRLFRPRYWHARLQLIALVGSMLWVTTAEPESLLNRIITTTGLHGWTWVAILMVITALAVVDIVINDILPDSIAVHSLKRWRYVVYMALAMGLISLCAVIVAAKGATSALLVWFVPGLGAAHLAFTDLFHRHQDRLIPTQEQANAVEVH